MATHSSVLAWRIPGTGEPGGLPSTGSSRTRLKRLSSSSSSMVNTKQKIWSRFRKQKEERGHHRGKSPVNKCRQKGRGKETMEIQNSQKSNNKMVGVGL